jgi:hypothetical protein
MAVGAVDYFKDCEAELAMLAHSPLARSLIYTYTNHVSSQVGSTPCCLNTNSIHAPWRFLTGCPA